MNIKMVIIKYKLLSWIAWQFKRIEEWLHIQDILEEMGK
jgi:hypothetical protein